MGSARFKEGFRATVRLCSELLADTRLADEMRRHEEKVAALKNQYFAGAGRFAIAAREHERAIVCYNELEREELLRAQSRLAQLTTEREHSRRRLVAAEAEYRSVTGAPFGLGRWLLRLTGPEAPRGHVVERAERYLSLIELLVPPRLRQEEIGDAREIIHRLVAEGTPGWHRRVRVKLISTVFWVLLNALRELAAGIFDRKSA